jgi:signal transduction histidine kinase
MLTAILLTLLTLGQLVIGTLLWIESRHTKRVDQGLFAFLSFLMVLWLVLVGALINVDATWAATRIGLFTQLNKFAFFVSCAILTQVYLFSLFYPVRVKVSVGQKIFIASGVLLSVASLLPALSGHFIIRDGRLIYSYGAFVVFIGVFAVASLTLIFMRELHLLRSDGDPVRARQARTLLTGLLFTIAHTLLFVLLLPAIWGQHHVFYAIGYAAPYYLTMFTSYGLLRQRLFDVRSFAARAAAYLFSSVIVAALFVSIAVTTSTVLLKRTIPASTLAIFIATTLVVAFAFQPLRLFFNKITNRLFYRDYYDPQDVLDRFSDVLVRTVNVDEMISRTNDILKSALHPQSITFLFLNNEAPATYKNLRIHLLKAEDQVIVARQLNAEHQTALYKALHSKNIAIAIRLRTTHEDLGFLLLGTRQSGIVYSTTDIRLLSVVADELAIGLQNALRFQEIEEFNKTLQQKIDEKTRSLQHANDKLRKMDQTKDDFISMASHQLRTPLTSVKGYVSMVLDGDVGALNRKQRDYLNQVFVSSQRMSYLISDLLNVSRLRTGKFIIDRNPCNLANVIHEEVSQLVETAKARELELIYRQPEHFPTLMLDEMKMRQVIMNFIDNAIYYTPSGGSITVTLTESSHSIEFTVTDTGIGVPRAEQHHLFSKFFRAQNARVARPDGTGLGLFMAKKVVTAQGGAIIFKSREGKGSTFGFTMPKTVVGMKDAGPKKIILHS